MIQDKIEQAREKTVPFWDNEQEKYRKLTIPDSRYSFSRESLLSLLREVAAEQREICAEQFMSKEFTSAKNVLEKVNLLENAPSQLDGDSHE